MFSKAEAKHLFLCYFYHGQSFFRFKKKKAKGAHEPKAQTNGAYPGFHEVCLEVSQGYPPPLPPAVCRRYLFIHPGEERPSGVKFLV